MLRREFVELLGVSSWRVLTAPGETESDNSEYTARLLVVLPEGACGCTVRILDDACRTVGSWRGTVKETDQLIDGGDVVVRSDHAFVRADSPSKSISMSFFWIEGMSKVIVDFPNETVHLVYRGTDEDTYWEARKRFAYHRRRMKDFMHRAKIRGTENRQRLWKQARRERELMYEAKRADRSMESRKSDRYANYADIDREAVAE